MADTLKWNFVGNDEITGLMERMDRVGSKLDRVLDALTATVAVMGKEMNAAQRGVNHLGDEMDRTSRKARELERSLAKVDTATFAQKFHKGFSSALSKTGEELKNSWMQYAIAAAVPLAAAIPGVIVAALAAVPIAAGVAGVIGDPQVQAAAASLGHEIKADFLDAASVFKGPVLNSILIVRNAWRGAQGDLRAIFAAAGPLLRPLVEGLTGMVTAMLPGIRHALEQAGPIIDVFAQELPRIGGEIGDIFKMLGDHADGIAAGLHVGLTYLEGMVKVAQGLLFVLTTVPKAITDAVTSLPEKLYGPMLEGTHKMGAAFAAAAPASAALTASIQAQQQAIEGDVQAMERLIDATLVERGIALGLKDTMAGFTDAVRENGTSLDENSAAGRRNLEMMNTALISINEEADAERRRQVALGNSAEAADLAAARLRENLINELIAAAQKAGYSTEQLERLVAAMRAADGTTIRLHVSYDEYRSSTPSRFRGDSAGGLIVGPGPKGVDSQLRMSAPGEYVLTSKAVDRIGVRELNYLNRGGDLTAIRPTGGPLPAGGAVATTRAGGGEQTINVRVIHQYPDGRVIVEQVQRLALGSGDRSLEAVFGLAAA